MVSRFTWAGSGITKAKKQNNQKMRFISHYLNFLLAALLTGTLWWDFNICSTKFFFDPFLAFGAFRHYITVRLGHPQGYQTPNWPQHSHFPESGIFQVILGEIGKNTVLACGLWIFWASHVWLGKKICLRVSNTYSQWLVPRNVKKTVFKTPFRNWGL